MKNEVNEEKEGKEEEEEEEEGSFFDCLFICEDYIIKEYEFNCKIKQSLLSSNMSSVRI